MSTDVKPDGPPYDGNPCPMCPIEIRNLAATAHNLLNRWDDWRRYGDIHAMGKFQEKIEDLRSAVQAVEPLSDAHFTDRKHSHGEGL